MVGIPDTRRNAMRHHFLLILALALIAGPVSGSAQDAGTAQGWRHGVSLLGDLKYPAGFQHFDYVDPSAPKGGTVRLSAPGSFDSFNFVPPKGVVGGGIGYLYQSLMASALDEASTQYGELADAVRFPADYASATYRLNPKARWHDGKPITPQDVVWSFETLKANNPQQAFYYKNVMKAEATGDHEVTFTFDKAGNRELPQIIGQLLVLPKHWWTGTDSSGKARDVTATTLEPPLGSGPYRIKSFTPGRSIVYGRVEDWWGADLPTARGSYNFDEVRFEYFLDRDVMREAFKGDAFDFRVENIAKDWATSYDIPAVREGRIVKQEFPDTSSGRMQAFAFNLRRDKFRDPRVRRAFNEAFDFEEMNKTLFFGLYTRIDSYFAGLDLASSGLPQGKELEILESVKDKVPPEVFTTPYKNPVNGSNEERRANLRNAVRLLKEAGWEVRDRRLVNAASGEAMTIEILLDNPAFERVALVYKQSLERLGIGVTIRTVDTAQFQKRQDDRDFDLIIYGQGQSQSPGNEQREYWGSDAADRPGSANIPGIKDPAVDALIDRVVYARDREELVAATKALDRLLMAGSYVVPMWRSATIRTLRWDRFASPKTLPTQSLTGGFPDVWWYDATRAAKVGATR
jgi:microcin C transport system substrate-binding protein